MVETIIISTIKDLVAPQIGYHAGVTARSAAVFHALTCSTLGSCSTGIETMCRWAGSSPLPISRRVENLTSTLSERRVTVNTASAPSLGAVKPLTKFARSAIKYSVPSASRKKRSIPPLRPRRATSRNLVSWRSFVSPTNRTVKTSCFCSASRTVRALRIESVDI